MDVHLMTTANLSRVEFKDSMLGKKDRIQEAAADFEEFFCSALGDSYTKMIKTDSFEQEMMNSIHLKKVITAQFVAAGVGAQIAEGVMESMNPRGKKVSPYPPTVNLSSSSMNCYPAISSSSEEYVPSEMLQAEEWGC